MQYGDINRERKTQIKSGFSSDKAIVSGVKKAVKAVKNFPQKASDYMNKHVYDKMLNKMAKK